jgi:hypothetical protein
VKRALIALALLTAACTDNPASPQPTTSTTTTTPARAVRVGVSLPPEPTANTYGGLVVRSLVYPQLFRATPEGKWQASLVEPGSDATRPGSLSARFRLRSGARWSDGTAITVSDLRRTLDGRVVTRIDDPTPRGTIVVHFSQPTPGWRRLWSGLEVITPSRDGLFGGPYTIDHVTPGLETVLRANRRYWGAKPAIGEVHLVLVPDGEIQARLMDKGELDVIAPFAFTDRTRRLERIDDARVVRGGARGGWMASLVANPSRLTPAHRQTLFALANGPRFTDVLLQGEATSTGERTAAPASPVGRPTPSITAPLESGPANLLLHGMQRAAHKAGRDFELRQAEFDIVAATYAQGEFDVLFRFEQTTPGTTSERDFVRDFRVLPLWRERPVAAVRDGLQNVSVNGFSAAGPTWNIEMWRWAR